MRIASLTLLFTVGLMACSEAPTKSAKPQSETAIVSGALQLPVSTNDVMVALVNDAADPIWMAAWKSPQSEMDWKELERRAYQLQLAGSLIAYPGTGALDHKWAAKPSWRQWSNQLRDTGADAVAAVENRDLVAIGNIGGQLVEVCEGCHIDFKLPFPTSGKFGELSPAPSEVE